MSRIVLLSLLSQIEEFIDELGYATDLIVRVKYKHNDDERYIYSNELLLFNRGKLSYEWRNGWYDGQQDVQLIALIPLERVSHFDRYYAEDIENE